MNGPSLYIYDNDALFPKKIPFSYVMEETILWTKHGVPIQGYRFIGEDRRTVWECPLGYPAGEIAVRFAKLRGRYCPYEDGFDLARLRFEGICKEQGIEFGSYAERKEFYEEFCSYYKEAYGEDWKMKFKSKAYQEMVKTDPRLRKT